MMIARKQKCNLVDQIYAIEHPQQRTLAQKFRKAYDYLSEDYQPQQILCRDMQMDQIKKFVKQFLETGHSKQSLYISGVPGIGKSLSVSRALKDLQRDKQISKNIQRQRIKIIKLNAMEYKHPTDLYKSLYIQLTSPHKKKSKISSHNALIALDGIFRKNQINQQDQKFIHIKKVVAIDQIDYLKTRDQDVLYNIFDWTQSQNSKLSVIAISNTINFPQILKPKIMSRIGNRRLIFKPYSSSQLQQILNQRVQQAQIFQKNVINFISKKIAKCSSDIRKCFQILTESIYLHSKSFTNFDSKNYKIKSDTVTKAYDAIYTDHFTNIYKIMQIDYKKILDLLAQHCKKQTRLMTIISICQQAKLKYNYNQKDTKLTLIHLMDMNVIQIKHTINPLANTRFIKEFNVKLNIDFDKIIYASLKYQSEDANH